MLVLTLTGCAFEPLPGAGASVADPVVDGLGSLSGTVQDAAGSPVPAAWITSTPRGYEAQAAEDGSFTLSLLPPGTHGLVVAAEGYETTEVTPVEVSADQVATVEVVLEETTVADGIVEVVVDGADGLPLAGAWVASGGAVAETDDAGVAVLSGLQGDDLLLTVDDPSGDHWGRSLALPTIQPEGGAQWVVALSGRTQLRSHAIGSGACAACHADLAESWSDTRHARALPAAPGPALLAYLETGPELALGEGATAAFSAVDGQGRVTLRDADGVTESWDFAGLIGDDDQAAVPYVDDGSRAWPLPVAWVAADPDRPGAPDAGPTLVPWETGRWLDDAGRLQDRDPAESADATCLPCHATGFELAQDADGGVTMTATRGSGRYLEAGVGCERCHGPGSEHRESAAVAPWQTVVQPADLDPARAVDSCGQCHQRTEAHGTGLPYPFDGSDRFLPGEDLSTWTDSAAVHWPSGAAAEGRMQVDELALSAHGAEGAGLRCHDCHDPHGGPAGAMLRAESRDNTLCLDCHLGLDFDGDDDLAEDHDHHARYDPDGPTQGGRCTGCHMPQTSTDVSWSALSGAGDLASHLFVALDPQDTVDIFDDVGATELPVGTFPPHACGDCHAWNAWDWTGGGVPFPGPDGDPTLRATHAEHADAFSGDWP